MNIRIFCSFLALLSLSYFTAAYSMQETLYGKEETLKIRLTKLLEEWIALSSQLNKDLKNVEATETLESELWIKLFEKSGAIKECLSHLEKNSTPEFLENNLIKTEEAFKAYYNNLKDLLQNSKELAGKVESLLNKIQQ